MQENGSTAGSLSKSPGTLDPPSADSSKKAASVVMATDVDRRSEFMSATSSSSILHQYHHLFRCRKTTNWI